MSLVWIFNYKTEEQSHLLPKREDKFWIHFRHFKMEKYVGKVNWVNNIEKSYFYKKQIIPC